MKPKPREFTGTLLDSPLGTTHQPPARSDYRRYRPCLRLDYGFRCAYCGCHEVDVSAISPFGLFEIDHFRPTSRKEFRKLKAVYTNLRWSCPLCNRTKKESWPSDEEQAMGYTLLDPVSDTISDHLSENADFELEGTTPSGEYFIDVFDLNSELHRKRRARKPVARLCSEIKAALAAEIGAATPEIHAKFAELSQLIDQALPFDAPSDCLCSKPTAHLRLVVP